MKDKTLECQSNLHEFVAPYVRFNLDCRGPVVLDDAMPKNVEVLRIEKDRIWVNPAVAVDEVAKVFLGGINEHLVTTYRRTWNEAIEAAAERVESDMHNYAEVIRRLKK